MSPSRTVMSRHRVSWSELLPGDRVLMWRTQWMTVLSTVPSKDNNTLVIHLLDAQGRMYPPSPYTGLHVAKGSPSPGEVELYR